MPSHRSSECWRAAAPQTSIADGLSRSLAMDANRRASRPVHSHVFLGRFSTSYRRQSELLVSPSTPCTLSPRSLESHNASGLRESREITVSTHGTPAQRPRVAGTRSTVIRPAHSSRTASCCLRRRRAVVRRCAYRWYRGRTSVPTTVHQTTCSRQRAKATCSRQRAADSVQQTACSRQRAADSIHRQRAADSRQRAADNMQRQRAADSRQRAVADTRERTLSRSTTCNIRCEAQWANLQHAVQRAGCSVYRTMDNTTRDRHAMRADTKHSAPTRQSADRTTDSIALSNSATVAGGCEKKLQRC
jgi:hypothetical protein